MQLISTLKEELGRLEASKEAVVSKFSQGEYDDLVKRWQEKLQRAQAGEQLWGRVTARKPQ